MKPWVVGLAAAMAMMVLGCQSRRWSPPRDPDLAEIHSVGRLKSSVVVVHARWFEEGGTLKETRGSGILLGYSENWLQIATAAHVVVDGPPTRFGVASDLSVVLPAAPGRPVRVHLVKSDANSDLAVLRVAESLPSSRKGNLVKLPVDAGYRFPFGDRVRTIGHPGDGRWMVSEHTVESGASSEVVVMTRGKVDPGSSGGPILTEEGRLVGMVTSVRGDEARGLPIAAVMRKLEAWGIPYRAAFSGEFRDTLYETMKAIWTEKIDGIRGSQVDLGGKYRGWKTKRSLWGQGRSLLLEYPYTVANDDYCYVEHLGKYYDDDARREAFVLFTRKLNEYLGDDWGSRDRGKNHVEFYQTSWNGAKTVEVLEEYSDLYVAIYESSKSAQEFGFWLYAKHWLGAD